MNKKALILILLSISSVHTNAMELPIKPAKRKRATSQPILTSHIPQKNKQKKAVYIEPSLPAILKQKIFTISSLCSTCTDLREAAITVNALTQVNTSLNAFINDDERTLQWIKELSAQFNEMNIEVTRMLCTKAANNRFALQRAFFAGWDAPQFTMIEKDVNRLKRIGFDLNFTYNHQQPTALIQAVIRQGAGINQADKIALWLIMNGADINILTSCKQSAAMLILMNTNRALMHIFLDHQDFKINHHDMEKQTPLHYCFYDKRVIGGNQFLQIDKTRCPHIYEIAKTLLEKGANPIAESNDGTTPLMLARETGYRPLIDLLEKAAVEWVEKNK